jgi:F-type H+-transporting ATPase subunit delta
MAEIKIAKRYAHSLLVMSREKGNQEAIIRDMELIHKTCDENRELVLLLRNPIIKSDTKYAILKQLWGSKIDSMSLDFLHLVTQKRRERYLDLIAREYMSAHLSGKGITSATVTTASGLDEAMKETIRNMVKNKTGGEVQLTEKIDSDLIGGFVLRIGDIQYDTSVIRSLRKVSRELNANSTIGKN